MASNAKPYLQGLIDKKLQEATTITDTAQQRGKGLTADQKTHVENLLEEVKGHRARIEEIDANEAHQADMDAMRGPVNAPAEGSGTDLGSAIIGAGFDLKHQPGVRFPAYPIFGRKTAVLPSPNVLAPNDPSLVPLGSDTRFLFPNLPRQDAGEATAVQDFKQTVQTVTGTVERAITATTDKAELNVTLTHVVEALKQFAVTISDIPNALLESTDLLSQFFAQKGRFVVEQAIDSHVIAQIVAAAPPFGNTGTGLIAQIRNAVTAMRAEGANPSIVVLNASDAATLDLFVDGAGGFVFPLRDTGSSSPCSACGLSNAPAAHPPTSSTRRCSGSCISVGSAWTPIRTQDSRRI